MRPEVRASALILAMALPAQAVAADLHLACQGVGTFPASQSTLGEVSGDINASGSATTVYRGRADGRVFFELTDAGARIRLPRELVPPINGGAHDGWWSITDLSIGEREITGRFRLNPLNRPKVRIDRLAGTIEVAGSFQMSFSGECRAMDPEARKF